VIAIRNARATKTDYEERAAKSRIDGDVAPDGLAVLATLDAPRARHRIDQLEPTPVGGVEVPRTDLRPLRIAVEDLDTADFVVCGHLHDEFAVRVNDRVGGEFVGNKDRFF